MWQGNEFSVFNSTQPHVTGWKLLKLEALCPRIAPPRVERPQTRGCEVCSARSLVVGLGGRKLLGNPLNIYSAGVVVMVSPGRGRR